MTESPDDPGSTPPPEVMAALDRIEKAQRKAEATGDLVALQFGWKVRRRFTRHGPLRGGGEYEVTIRMEDGRPLVESLTVMPNPPVQNITFDQRDIVDEAVRNEALAMTATWSEPGSVSEQFDRALVAARRARRRKLTPEFLREVLDQHDEGGVALVMQKQCTTERTAYRWLARANEELQ